MKKIINVKGFLLIPLVALYSFIQQSTNEDQIYWTDQKLQWTDFTAAPDMEDTSNSALTYYGIACSIKTKGDSVSISVKSLFDRTKSWVKPADKTDSLLMHEQRHFDIAELYARILKKKIKERSFHKSTLMDNFNELYKNNAQELNAEQSLYDDETAHGRNSAKQSGWNDKISKKLEDLELYSNEKVTTLLIK